MRRFEGEEVMMRNLLLGVHMGTRFFMYMLGMYGGLLPFLGSMRFLISFFFVGLCCTIVFGGRLGIWK